MRYYINIKYKPKDEFYEMKIPQNNKLLHITLQARFYAVFLYFLTPFECPTRLQTQADLSHCTFTLTGKNDKRPS